LLPFSSSVVFCQVDVSVSDWHSSRVWYVCVWWWSLDNQEAMAHWGPLRNGEKLQRIHRFES
jgi:hypothetical protein